MENNQSQQPPAAQPPAQNPPSTQPAQQSPNTGNQQFYVQAAVPVEKKGKNPGKKEGIIAILFAVLSLLFFPPIFGTAGIVLGVLSLRKGQKTLGLIAIILSAIFMVIGMILGIAVNMMLKHNIPTKGSVGGTIGGFLVP